MSLYDRGGPSVPQKQEILTGNMSALNMSTHTQGTSCNTKCTLTDAHTLAE